MLLTAAPPVRVDLPDDEWAEIRRLTPAEIQQAEQIQLRRASDHRMVARIGNRPLLDHAGDFILFCGVVRASRDLIAASVAGRAVAAAIIAISRKERSNV